ncbi:hypothetical protein SAMN05216421_2271 [Halopseudomonas xinjiangensis]|uniref:Uncharacterized protein n=1 Tax=Halopseudomonas xinjiangensis TaxID=487184 RepID=A0A1H1VCU2_9GAMM|nr:hypothetical protein [Halopseudomonas xinjiangensis]SDS82602.1 hypothetical protein SAMN05216421_2271 [Halopseudomonas xinjiangensis]
MSPESYVLLLISCWLLLASALLWGMLRIARRHYPADETCEQRSEPENSDHIVARGSQQGLNSLPQMHPGHFARTFGPSSDRARC